MTTLETPHVLARLQPVRERGTVLESNYSLHTKYVKYESSHLSPRCTSTATHVGRHTREHPDLRSKVLAVVMPASPLVRRSYSVMEAKVAEVKGPSRGRCAAAACKLPLFPRHTCKQGSAAVRLVCRSVYPTCRHPVPQTTT